MLTGFNLFVAGVVYTVLVAVGGFFVGKRNGSKADDLSGGIVRLKDQAQAVITDVQTKTTEITDTLKK
jgi:hypothetical protein